MLTSLPRRFVFRQICFLVVFTQIMLPTNGVYAGTVDCKSAAAALDGGAPRRVGIVPRILLALAFAGFNAGALHGQEASPSTALGPVTMYPSLMGNSYGGSPLHDPIPFPSLSQWNQHSFRPTLDVDRMTHPVVDSIVRALGGPGTLAAKNFKAKEAIGEHRGVAITIKADKGDAYSVVENYDQYQGMRYNEKLGKNAELFLTWAGKPKEGAATPGPTGFEGLHEVDLTQNGGNRFVVRHSGSAGKAEVRVYDEKDPETYSIGYITFPASQGLYGTDFYLPFTELKPGPNGKMADLTKAGGISMKYIMQEGSVTVVQPPPCGAPCGTPGTTVQVAVPLQTRIHYVGVVGPEVSSGGLLGDLGGLGGIEGLGLGGLGLGSLPPLALTTPPGGGGGGGGNTPGGPPNFNKPPPGHHTPPPYCTTGSCSPPENHGHVVPEPASITLLITGGMTAAGWWALRRKKIAAANQPQPPGPNPNP